MQENLLNLLIMEVESMLTEAKSSFSHKNMGDKGTHLKTDQSSRKKKSERARHTFESKKYFFGQPESSI